MKKMIAVSLLVAVMGGVSSWAARDVGGGFGALATARGIGMGNASIMGGLGLGDATTAFGVIRYGFDDYFDGRVKLGLRDEGSSDAVFIIGADVTYQLWAVGTQSQDPIDLAFGGMVEYYSPEFIEEHLPDGYDESIWQIGVYAIASYPFLLDNGMTVAPYGRLNLRIEDINPNAEPFDHTTELELGLNAGAMLEITETLNAYGELQLDGNNGVFLGLEFILL